MDRRYLLKLGGVSLATTAAVPLSFFDPSKARAEGAAFKILTPAEVATIEMVSDVLVPGARHAGVSHFVDHELSTPSPRLLLRYMMLRGPMAPYYQKALGAYEASMKAQGHGDLSKLTPDVQRDVVETLRAGKTTPWDGGLVTPAVFYSMMRNDGVDVVYGSVQGFKNLEVPYLAHIMPKTTW